MVDQNPQQIELDDPLFDNQWHLFKSGSARVDINLSDVWNDYTGDGVVVGVIEGAVQWTHPDLIGNYDTSLDFSGTNNSADVSANGASSHATAVAGLIAAEANGEGVVGVAYDSTLVSYHTDFSGSFYTAFERVMDVAIDGNGAYGIDRGADIINNSWAFTSPFAGNFNSGFSQLQTMGSALEEAAEFGREGLGTVMLWAAGNDRNDASGQWANGSNVTNSPHTIAVAAVDAQGDVASYSNPGANLLISAPSNGGSQAIVTTTTGSGYTLGFGGTSAATPIVAGVTALMLEANPDLGYRDVQEILAYSARHTPLRDVSQPDNTVAWTLNAAEGWNGGGLLHNNDFGFGLIDAHAAVRLAESWDKQQLYGDRQIASGSDQQAGISFDFGTPTLEASINISAGFAVEHAEVTLDLSHGRADHLLVELIAPSGTRSVLMDGNGANNFFPGNSFALSSTAFWGEDSAGTWQIEVTDTAAGTSGSFGGWTLTLYGKDTADSLADVYVFTNEYSDFAAGDASRLSLTDGDGGIDTVNAAPVTADSVIDLGGGTSTIDGVALDIDQRIENAVGGDGNDRLLGSGKDNSLTGGRGSDTLIGGNGEDTLEGGAGADDLAGGAGFDVASYASAMARVSVRLDNPARNEGDAAGDSYSSIESIVGSSYNDYLRGDYGADNHFEGLAGDDVFLGLSGANSLFGGAGDDRFYSGTNADLMDGGSDVDTVFYARSSSGVRVDLQSGTGHSGFAEGDRLVAIENLYGSDHDDTLSGDGGVNQLVGHAGDDILMGYGDDDRLFGREGNDTLLGGEGGDRLEGGQGFDVASYEQSSTGLVADLLSPSRSSGEAAGDELRSIEGLRGSAFGDGLYGDNNGNLLDGFDGNDVIVGRAGANSMLGGAGNDRLYSGRDADSIDGGADLDAVFYAYSDTGVEVDLLDGVGQFGFAEGDRLTAVENLYGSDHADTLRGDQDANLIVGQDGDDVLLGRGGNDRVLGRNGDDTLEGGEGNDRLEGGEGDDVLLGGAGNDRLIGDLGADVFVFTLGDGRDTIDDFDPVNDLLDLASWGLSSFSELDVTDGDNGAEISFNGSDQLILDGVETLSIEDAWAIWA